MEAVKANEVIVRRVDAVENRRGETLEAIDIELVIAERSKERLENNLFEGIHKLLTLSARIACDRRTACQAPPVILGVKRAGIRSGSAVYLKAVASIVFKIIGTSGDIAIGPTATKV